MTIFGWDASQFDWSRGPMDLTAARRDGIDFFTHKATEGTTTKHDRYGEAMRRARAAGVPFLGAYHVVRSGSAVETQVAYCLAYANAQTPWWVDHPGWFWQVDLELWPYDAVPASRGEQFADLIEARTGRRAIIYASKGQYGDQLRGTSHPLWNANYPSSRAAGYRDLYPGDRGAGWAAYSGVTPAIWQYSSKATIGSQPTCDANAFRGTVADFARLIGATSARIEGDDVANTWTEPLTQGTAGYAGQQRDTALAFAWQASSEAAAGVGKLLAAAEADEVRDRAALAAIQALATGGGVDGAPIVAAVNAVRDEARARFAELGRENAELRAELAAARAAAEANLSPAERAGLPSAG